MSDGNLRVEHAPQGIQGLGWSEHHLYKFSVEWHMQLMHWLPVKCVSTDFSSASWYLAATAEPPPRVLPDRPTPA